MEKSHKNESDSQNKKSLVILVLAAILLLFLFMFMMINGQVKKIADSVDSMATEIKGHVIGGTLPVISAPVAQISEKTCAIKSEKKHVVTHHARHHSPEPVQVIERVPSKSVVTKSPPSVQVAGLGDTFETIKGGDRECVVYFNGVRMYSQFVWGDSVTTKQKCDVFAAAMYAKHNHGATPSGEEVASIQVPQQAKPIPAGNILHPEVVSAPVNHFCVRSGKKYDCHDKVVVIREGGEIQCLPPEQAKESGDQLCTGIQ